MTPQQLLEEFGSLPEEARRQVADFITFLRQKYRPVPGQKSDIDLMKDNFIGMWRDREDLKDSTGWVRSTREKEWSPSDD